MTPPTLLHHHLLARLLGPPVACLAVHRCADGWRRRQFPNPTSRHEPLSPPLVLLRLAHNVLMSTYSVFAFAVCVQELWKRHSTLGVKDALCRTPCATTVPLWEMSKYWELADLWFLALANKSPRKLITFHHMSAGMLTAANLVLRKQPTPLFHYAVLANSFVHIGVYAHFARPMPHLRRVITAAQACQHLFVVALLVTTLLLDECADQPTHAYAFSLSIYVVYAIAFARLYVELHGKRVRRNVPLPTWPLCHKAKVG